MKVEPEMLAEAVSKVPSESNETPSPQVETPPAVSLDQFNELKAQFDKVSAFATRMKDDEKAEREKRQAISAEKDEAQTQLSKQAELIAAMAKHNETLLGALKTVQPIVEERQSEIDAAKVTVAERMENGLPSFLKTALVNWEDAPLRALAAIEDYDASAQTPKATPEAGPRPALSNSTTGTPGNETAQVDFGQLMAEGAKLADLRRQFPEQWAQQKGASANAAGPNVTADNYLGGMFGGSAGTQKGR